MAYITNVSGGSQPVFATDVLNGNIAQTANIAAQGPFNPAGPKLDFFSVVANASVASTGGVNQYVANVLQAVQQTATVAIFQVGSNPQTMNFAIFPTGAYTNATFVAAVQTANGAIGVNTANVAGTATFTNLASIVT
jgi:hypothetical protein